MELSKRELQCLWYGVIVSYREQREMMHACVNKGAYDLAEIYLVDVHRLRMLKPKMRKAWKSKGAFISTKA